MQHWVSEVRATLQAPCDSIKELTRSDTEVAISSIMMSSSVVPGIRMDAKYSVIFGEQHLAKTDTSCISLILETRP